MKDNAIACYDTLYLSKQDSLYPCSIPAHLSNALKYHQIQGLRFLYRNLIQDIGTIYNDATGLGKRLTISTILHSFFYNDSKLISSVLILCMNNDQVDIWNYILQFFIGQDVVSLSAFERAKKGILVQNIKMINCNISMFNEIHCVVSELPDEFGWNYLRKILQYSTTRKRIIVTDKKIKDKIETLWSCINWTNPELIGNKQKFLNKYRTKDFKTKGVLSALLTNILIRREICHVIDDFPLVDEQDIRQKFRNWKKTQKIKLTLTSDSQTTNSDSDNQRFSASFDIKKVSTYNVSSPVSSPTYDESETVKVSDNSKTFSENSVRETISLNNKNLLTIYKNNSNGPEVVSAHIVSPTQYTSDETFDTLNLLFPKTDNVRKRRSPKKRKADVNKWIDCSKESTVTENQTSHTDLMMISSDDSILNTNFKVTEAANDKTLQKLCSYSKWDNETENILENIFFS